MWCTNTRSSRPPVDSCVRGREWFEWQRRRSESVPPPGRFPAPSHTGGGLALWGGALASPPTGQHCPLARVCVACCTMYAYIVALYPPCSCMSRCTGLANQKRVGETVVVWPPSATKRPPATPCQPTVLTTPSTDNVLPTAAHIQQPQTARLLMSHIFSFPPPSTMLSAHPPSRHPPSTAGAKPSSCRALGGGLPRLRLVCTC